MPFLTAPRAGKVDQYQTYAFPMAGSKRKLIADADDSGPTASHTAAQATSKKICRDNNDGYNPKFMAHLCFGAHIQRILVAGMANYPWHVQEDYEQDLTCMFMHAHSKGSFRPDTAARHMIPRLAGIAPRSKKDKTAMVRVFIKHYDTVKEDLLLILNILSNPAPLDLDLVTSIRTCVASLHVTLESTRWRTIIPYTPLPKTCLSRLRNFVADSKQSHLLDDLTDHVSDIESWLNPPSPLVEFPTRLTASVMDTLQPQTEKSPDKAKASPLVQSDASTELTANTEKQRIQRLHLLEERITQTNLLAEQRLNQINLSKNQLDQALLEQARLIKRVKTLELTTADQIAQHKLKEEAWITSRAELAKQHRHQIRRQSGEIDRLKAALITEQEESAILKAEQNNKVAQLNAALRAVREKSDSIEANVTRLVVQATDGVNTSIGVPDSSDSTTNNSFSGTSSSSNAIFSKLTDGQASLPHPFLHVKTPRIYKPLPLAMECVDVCMRESIDNSILDIIGDSEMDVEPPTQTNFSNVSRPNLLTQGQLNRFEKNKTNGVAPQSHPGQDKVFKEACRGFKLDRCRYGSKCRFPHEACRHWLNGNCKHAEHCYGSHDPFFLEKSDLQASSYQSFTPVQHTHTPRLQNDKTLINQLDAQRGLGQGLNQSIQQKKQACRNHLSNVCNKGQDCEYAHAPCSYFISGACKFTDQTCRRSHDPLFIMQGSVPSNRSPFAASEQKKQPDLQSNLHHLDQIIRVAGKMASRPVRISGPVSICKSQKGTAGCTNPRCRYRHEPPKPHL